MKYSEAKPGRVFILRLEDGEIVHEVIEAFAAKQSIWAASLIILGGADGGAANSSSDRKRAVPHRSFPWNMSSMMSGKSPAREPSFPMTRETRFFTSTWLAAEIHRR